MPHRAGGGRRAKPSRATAPEADETRTRHRPGGEQDPDAPESRKQAKPSRATDRKAGKAQSRRRREASETWSRRRRETSKARTRRRRKAGRQDPVAPEAGSGRDPNRRRQGPAAASRGSRPRLDRRGNPHAVKRPAPKAGSRRAHPPATRSRAIERVGRRSRATVTASAARPGKPCASRQRPVPHRNQRSPRRTPAPGPNSPLPTDRAGLFDASRAAARSGSLRAGARPRAGGTRLGIAQPQQPCAPPRCIRNSCHRGPG